jgi:hypothetical protein
VRRLALLAIVALAVSGCALLPDLGQGPQACIDAYPANQCLAMTDVAAADVSKNRGDVIGIVIVPDPAPDGATLGGAWPIHVRVAFRDGTTHDARLCGGVSIAPACTQDPTLRASSILGGYTDVPCAGEAPDSCATPHPSIEADAADAAAPLTIDERTIPIDRIGLLDIPLGEATLPNGILTEASFEFVETWPADVALAGGSGVLGIRSLEPDGKPFDNYYLHGWRPGLERVAVTLQLEVLYFEPGADLVIRNVVVR